MRVAFDEQIFAIQRHGGISRVFAELAREFEADPAHDVELQPIAAPVLNAYILGDPQTAEKLAVWPGRHWSITLGRSMLRRRHRGPADLVHSSFYLPRMLKDYPQARRVVTVYDMIPELFPDTRRRLDVLTRKHAYLKRADHIISISASTRDDLHRIYPDVTAPVSVVHLGVAPAFTPGLDPLPGLPERYVLHVGNRSDYKDGATLLRAFAHIAAQDSVELVLAGGGPLTAAEQELITQSGIAGRVHQVPVDEAALPRMYANAAVLVFPSQYEGFGLPAIEAMACGTPVVLCRASSLPEVGGNAARYFEPGDDAGLAAGLLEILGDPGLATTLSQQGRARAEEFTWHRTARQTVEVYREVLSR